MQTLTSSQQPGAANGAVIGSADGGELQRAYARLRRCSKAPISDRPGDIDGQQHERPDRQLNDQIALATSSAARPTTCSTSATSDPHANQSIGVTRLKQSDGRSTCSGQRAGARGRRPGHPDGMGPDPSNPQNIVVGTKAGNSIVPLSTSGSAGGTSGVDAVQPAGRPDHENQIGRLAW